VGVMRPEKGLATLLQAVSLLKAKYPHVTLKIVGTTDRKTKAKADRRIRELNLSGNVEFPGWLEWRQIADELSTAWAMVVPSTYEPFGCTTVEAMAAGQAVVGSRTGGIAENIVDGECGLLFEPGNAEQLAEQLDQLFSDEDYRRRLGENAARRARNLWHPDVVAHAHYRLYAKILNSIGREHARAGI
jgi:glycosyltransferase involved in cell wall biosynthesis